MADHDKLGGDSAYKTRIFGLSDKYRPANADLDHCLLCYEGNDVNCI